MPIYEYRCGECGFQSEFLQKISDPPLSECPKCGKGALAKLLSAAGFQLKGSGWYATDFKNNGTGKAASSTPKEDGGSQGGGGSETSAGPSCGAGACPACT